MRPLQLLIPCKTSDIHNLRRNNVLRCPENSEFWPVAASGSAQACNGRKRFLMLLY